jgi:hypothetical protein
MGDENPLVSGEEEKLATESTPHFDSTTAEGMEHQYSIHGM